MITSLNLFQKNFYGKFQKPHDQDCLFQEFLKHNQPKSFLFIGLLDHIYVILQINVINRNKISLYSQR